MTEHWAYYRGKSSWFMFIVYDNVLRWLEVIRQDIEDKGLNEGILLDRNEWRKLIHVSDPA